MTVPDIKLEDLRARVLPLLPNPCSIPDAVEIIRDVAFHTYADGTVKRALERWGIAVQRLSATQTKKMRANRASRKGQKRMPRKAWDDLSDPPTGSATDF